VGSARAQCEAIAARFPGLFDLYQYSWSPLDAVPAQIVPGACHILHRTVMTALRPLADRIAGDREFAASASAAIGLDLARSDELSRVLISAAIAANPGGLVLAGSRSIARMESNIAAIRDPRYGPAGAALLALLDKERER